ncbi:MAG TPA: hypothetical protein VFT10_09415 [Solirubrobacterales bacterium]|nr:hypothetical protein [Solirubrobacterales bacterium]
MIEFLIAVVPLLLLVGLLLCGRYPGHHAAMRLVERIASRSRRGTESASREPRPWAPAPRFARGGLLIAFRLAQRPPPPAS